MQRKVLTWRGSSMVCYCFMDSFFLLFFSFNQPHFLTQSGLIVKVSCPNLRKGSGSSVLSVLDLTMELCLIVSLCWLLYSMELPPHFPPHLQDSTPHTGRVPLRIDEMPDLQASETGPGLPSSSQWNRRLWHHSVCCCFYCPVCKIEVERLTFVLFDAT